MAAPIVGARICSFAGTRVPWPPVDVASGVFTNKPIECSVCKREIPPRERFTTVTHWEDYVTAKVCRDCTLTPEMIAARPHPKAGRCEGELPGGKPCPEAGAFGVTFVWGGMWLCRAHTDEECGPEPPEWELAVEDAAP